MLARTCQFFLWYLCVDEKLRVVKLTASVVKLTASERPQGIEPPCEKCIRMKQGSQTKIGGVSSE